MSTGTIQIPVLFDMSGDSIVFGEDATGADFVDSHLQFLLDMTTEANGISLNASDISSAILIGDTDNSDNLFYDGDANGLGVDTLCNRIAKAITRGKLVHVPSIGNFSNSGIPIGGEKYLYNALGQIQDPGTYTKKYTTSIAPVGDEQMLGQAMARIASIHLIGDPLGSQAFEDATSIQTDLETASGQTFNSGNTAFYNALAVQLSKVLGGSKSSNKMPPGIIIGSDPVATEYDVTSALSTITGQTVTASSESNPGHATFQKENAVDGIPAPGVYWKSLSNFNTDGSYAGSFVAAGVTGYNTNSWPGQWIQIDVGQTVVLSQYKIHPRRHASVYMAAPKEGYLVSSSDGKNWFEIHHLTLDDTTGRELYYDGTNYGSVDTDITSADNREGRYFAFVMKKAFTTTYPIAAIGQIEMLGVTKAQQDGGSPPAAYDVVTVTSTLHNTTDNRVITSSSAYNTTSYANEHVFEPAATNSFMFGGNPNLNTTTGEWHTNHDHFSLASGIKGEWLQIDVGQDVYVNKIIINGYDHATYWYYSPREIKLLSSKDGITYNVIKEYTGPINGTDYYTSGVGYKNLAIDIDSANPPADENDTRIGRYFKLVISKTFPTGIYVAIQQLTLNGMKYPTEFGTAAATTNNIYEPNVTPYDVTSIQSTLTDAANHRFSASSESNPGHATYQKENAFDGNHNGVYWTSYTNSYNTIGQSGGYWGRNYTGDLSGEWIQVDLSENVLGTYYQVWGYNHTSYANHNVKKGYLLSSLDGLKWNLAHTLTVSDKLDWYEGGDKGYSVPRHTIPNSDARKGKHWRFIINQTFGGSTQGKIGELMVFGVKYPSQVTEGNGALVTNSVKDYTTDVTPYDLTSIHSTLSGQVYSASSHGTTNANNVVAKLFDNNYSFYWYSLASQYNTAGDISGSYYGPHVTAGYPGEWVQVDVGRLVTATMCIMNPNRINTSYIYYNPHSGTLLSSLDGNKWNFVTSWTNGAETTKGETWYNNSCFHSVEVPLSGVNATARYFRMVFTKSNDHDYVALSQFTILGVQNPEEVTQGTVTTTNSNIPLYVPTVSSYELAAKDSLLADSANHKYSASSIGSANGNYQVEKAFEYSTPASTTYWYSTPAYNIAAGIYDGIYTGTYYTGDLSGDWIQVDLSENVYVTKAVYLPYMHSSYYTYSMRKGYLLSSLDGKKWNLIYTIDHNDTDGSSIYSNGTYHPTICNITSSKNSIGRYFRLVINRTFGGSASGHVGKFKLYGVRYPSQITEGDGAINTTELTTYTSDVTPYEVHYLADAANHKFSASEIGSANANYQPNKVFDGSPDSGQYWYPLGNMRYSTTTGFYQGATCTNDISGEWIQIDLSENIYITKYQVHGYWHSSYYDYSPKKGSLLSSLDGLKWTLVDTFQNADSDGSFYYTSPTFTWKDRDVSGVNCIGRYFRFVVQQGYPTSANPYIGQIRIFGVKHPSETSQGHIVVDVSDNSPGYILTATPYDVTSTDSSLSDSANHKYSASSIGSANASYQVEKAFNNPLNSTSYYWYPEASTYSTAGLYQFGRTTIDSSGEWIQVDLSENVFVDNYSVGGYFHSSYMYRSPKAGTLFSSMNGTLWKQVHTFELGGTNGDVYYNATEGYSTQYFNITHGPNCIGRYFRFVVNKTWNTMPIMHSFQINGVKYPSQVTTQSILIEPALNINVKWTTDSNASFDVASSASTLSGQSYSASSVGSTSASYQVEKAFNNELANASYYWYSSGLKYNTQDGHYYGFAKTGIWMGEWIQVDIGQNVNITNYKIYPYSHSNSGTSYYGRNVKKGHLLSSLDGLKWYLVHTHNDTGAMGSAFGYPASSTTPASYDLAASNTVGRYFRFVVESTYGGTTCTIAELQLNGTLTTVSTIGESDSTAERYNSFSTKTGTSSYNIYTSTLAHTTNPYDIASSNSSINGQAYSASVDNGDANTVFNNNITTSWATNYDYNAKAALATNEPAFSSAALHLDASGNNRIELTFNSNLSSNDINGSNFTVTTLDLSENIPSLIDISGGKLMIEKQAEITGSIFYEDFDDQLFTGDAATADIVSPGRDGATGYAIQGHDVNPSTKYWKKSITHRALSFWHHFTNTNYNGTIWSTYFDVNDKNNSALNMHHYSTHYRYAGGNAASGKWTKFYVDGVEKTPYAHNTGISNGWHHLYLEFNVDVPQATFLAKCNGDNDAFTHGSADKIDEVRFYSQGIAESDLILMAGGWNGRYPGATFPNTNYRINYVKDASSVRHVVKEQAPYSSTEDTSVGATKSWEAITSSADGTKLAATVQNGNIWTSSNSGATWIAENTEVYESIIAVGSGGILYKYTGSGSWTSKTSGTSEIIAGIVYGNDKWVAAARSGTNSGMTALVSTDDGDTWTNNQVHNDKVARGIGYGDGKFVMFGNNGKIFTSTNGTSWTERTSGITTHPMGIIYGNGLFVISGASGVILTSTDGITWTSRTTGTSEALWSLAYGNGVYVAAGNNGTIITSTDGISWTSRTSGISDTIYTINYDNAMFVAGRPDGKIVYSSDGITWSSTTYSGGPIRSLDYYKGLWYAGQDSGEIISFADPTSTTHTTISSIGSNFVFGLGVSTNSSHNWRGITSSDDGVKLAAGVWGGNIWTSSNSGATWTEITVGDGTNNWKGITSSADGTKLAATVNGGNIWTSSDSGANWAEITVGDGTNDWFGITSSADGTKLAAGVYGGNIWTSSNSGAAWTEDTSVGATKNWQAITSSDDGVKLAAVVYQGNIWTSNNSGATWTVDTSIGDVKSWQAIASSADGTKLAATAYSGNIWTSSNSGATWTEDTSVGATKNWIPITSSADGTKLAAGGNGNNIWTFAANTQIPINNFIIRSGTLISRGSGYGEYSGSTSTTHNTNQTYTGEHVNVNIGQSTLINNYTIHVPTPYVPTNSHDNPNPKSWILLGSTDNSAWSKIHEVTDYASWTTASSYGSGFEASYTSSSITQMVAQYYRLIINKTQERTGIATVAELIINGVKHTSETTGITITKTASLGTAANAFDNTITNSWDTSSSATYSLIASPATNEPTFSSIAVNSGKLELTFSANVAVTGALISNDFNIADNSGTTVYITPTIANNKLLLEYLTLPASQIYHESFDNEDVTFHANADIVYVNGRVGGKAMSTIDQSPSGFQWIQKVSDSSLPSNVRAVSFQIKIKSGVSDYQNRYIFDLRGEQNTSTAGGNRAIFFRSNTLRMYNASNAEGTASGNVYLPGGNQPTIWFNGVKQFFSTNSSSYGAIIQSESETEITTTVIANDNWHHFYIEFPDGETLPDQWVWLTAYNGGSSHCLEASIDDLRYYNAPLIQANIDSLAAGGNGGLSGSFTHTNFEIGYTKSGTAAQNIVNAAHTSVPVNTFFVYNGVEQSRGSVGQGDYRGSTSTTYNTNKTYTGEYVQVDMGQNILMTEYYLHVPSISYSNPKNWKLLVSSNGTAWTEAHDISANTSWADSSYISSSSYGSGKQFNASTLANDYIGRYFRLIVNKVTGSFNHVKIAELQIKGVMHTLETQSDNNPTPVAATATPSDNTTTVTDSTVTSTTHLNNDTTTTTTTETQIVIAANTETTTTKKTNEAIVTTATPNFGQTATASNTVTTHSDSTATTTTYVSNDTATRTLVMKTVDISANTFTTTTYNTVITETINGVSLTSGSGSSFDPNKILDASGVACPALKSIYEQLMNIPGRSQIMKTRDVTNSPMDSSQNITGGFPFIAGDKMVMYLRPKIKFGTNTFPEQFTTVMGFGGIAFDAPVVDTALANGSGGAISGQTYTESSKYSATYAGSKLFDGSVTTFWITANDTYNSSTGVTESGSTTIHADDGGGTYAGQYVQIQFANEVAIEKIKITPRNLGGGGAGEPTDFRILSSTDGTTFRVAYSVTDGTLNDDWSLWSTQTFDIPNLRAASAKGTYWRIAVNKITTGNKVQLAKVQLIGNLSSGLVEVYGGGNPTSGSVLDISGLVTNTANTASTFAANFPGNATGGNEAEAEKYGWVGSTTPGMLSLETTDETDVNTMDLHIWKVTITL